MTNSTPDADDTTQSSTGSARLATLLIGKSAAIAAAVVVLAAVMRFRLAEVFLVGSVALAAALMMALSEFETIAAGRRADGE